MSSPTFGRFGEAFQVGQVFHHPVRKTITESDNNLFSLLTMNHHPIHLDAEFASKSRFGQRVVVGTLVLSLAVGLSVSDLSGVAIAALSYDKVRHLAPVHIGDTISASSEILDVQPRGHDDTYVISVSTTVTKQEGVPVLTFERSFLVPKGA